MRNEFVLYRADLLMNLEHAKIERRIIRQMNFKIASEIDYSAKQVRLEEKHINAVQEICLALVDLLQKLNREVSIFRSVSKSISNY